MSRSGYNDDCDGWSLIRWRGAVKSAIKGKRGQQFLRELANALDAMPEKRLIADELQAATGEFCTIGVLGAARGIDMSRLDPDDRDDVAKAFDIAPALAAEIVFENDERGDIWAWADVEVFGPIRPWEWRVRQVRVPVARVEEQRWTRMRKWVDDNLIAEEPKS